MNWDSENLALHEELSCTFKKVNSDPRQIITLLSPQYTVDKFRIRCGGGVKIRQPGSSLNVGGQ